MKHRKFNKNIMLFVICAVFVIVGLGSSGVIRPIGASLYNVVLRKAPIGGVKKAINSSLDDGLLYHAFLMDLSGLKENLLGTRIVKKSDTTVVKSDAGSLIAQENKKNEADLKEIAARISEIKDISENNGSAFLYCAVPTKEYFESAPTNINNYCRANYGLFLSALMAENIPVLDLSAVLTENESTFDLYYYTDHHWTARAGFEASRALAEELNTRYGFRYDSRIADIANYHIERYRDWFLGSKGKKVGTCFTWHGADDFDLITPKFDTDLVEEQPFKNQLRSGDFTQTVLFMENMEKDYYKVNTYATYCGGDSRLQIIKNNLNPQGEKVLLIRDSFGCAMAPFLALQTGELHICDVRDGDGYVGEKIDIAAYIRQIQPDFVLMLYRGTSPT